MRYTSRATAHSWRRSGLISPQCGFASVFEGNELDEDAQWRKLELVARAAERTWGSPP
jgi:hypothetical protein